MSVRQRTPGQVPGVSLLLRDDGPSWWFQRHFPLEVYPPALRMLVEQVAESLSVHPDMPATAILPIVGALIGDSRWVQCREDWKESPKIWAAIIAEPGGKKSPTLDRLVDPLAPIEEKLEAQHDALVKDWEALPAKGRPDRPKPIRLVVSDITTEALGDRVRAHPRGVLVYRDELSGWLNSLGQYRSREGDDRQQWLELWRAGAVLRNDRKTGDGSSIHRRAFVGLLGGIQPEKLKAIRGRDGDDGMLDRFLLCLAPDLDEVWGTPPVERIVRDAYAELVRELYALSPICVGHRSDPLIVKLDVGGQAIRDVEFENHLSQKNNMRRQKSPLRGAWGKFDAYGFRIALVLTELWSLCEETPEVVDEHRMNDAWRVVDFFKHQANRVLGDGGLLEASEYRKVGPADESAVVAWLRKRGGKSTLRDMRRNGGPLSGVDVETAKKLLGSTDGVSITQLDRGQIAVVLDHPA